MVTSIHSRVMLTKVKYVTGLHKKIIKVLLNGIDIFSSSKAWKQIGQGWAPWHRPAPPFCEALAIELVYDRPQLD